MIDYIALGVIALGVSFIMAQSPGKSKLDAVFEACNLHTKKAKPILIKAFSLKREGEVIGHKYIYTIPPGIELSDFEKCEEAIKAQTDAYAVEIYTKGSNKVHIELHYKPLEKELEFTLHKLPGVIGIPIGFTKTKKLISVDLTNLHHLLVGGITGFGKSNFLRQLLVTLANNPKVRLFIIDLKRLEFSFMKQHAWVATNLDEAMKVVKYLHAEMFRRMDILEPTNASSLSEYDGDLPYLVLLIDEYSQLCPALADGEVKKQRQEIQRMLIDIMCLARSEGIFVINSMQRPDKDILPGQLKGQFGGTIAFRTRNRVNSEILLDNDNAVKLHRPGQLILQHLGEEQYLQSMFLSKQEAKNLLPEKPTTKPVQNQEKSIETSKSGEI